MNRTATTEKLQALIAAHATEIATLTAENEKLAQRVTHLEEQLRLERLHRYAPRSEKLKERIFNEAEQAAAEGEEADDVEADLIADTGLPDAEQPEPKKRGRKPLSEGLPRERVEHDLRIPLILITLFTMPEEGMADSMTWRWTVTTDG